MPEQTTRLAEIEARAAAATPGPWQNDQAEIHQGMPDAPDIWVAWIGEALDIDDQPQSNNNAAFIAHAREDIPYLLDRVAELEAKLAAIRHLHKDSPMGPCPVCFDGDDHVAGGDGLVPYPCPTARLAGAEDCDPPKRAAA
ncbi:hypothetical protein [Streptomyces sp. NPDC056154]|uniref:hypothetical protein n=1 Tax=unclassified Streptomyces TaxID=2593676 RepID=UPI0035D768B0